MEDSKKEYEKAIAYIRSLIIDKKITIGSRIPSERKIAEELSISRNSTREALKRLENMGLLESYQGRGNYLSGHITQSFSNAIEMMMLLKQTDAADICQFRRAMEKTAYGLAYEKRHNNSCISEMSQLFAAFPQAPLVQQIEIDEKIHYLLVRATGNALLITMMDSLAVVYHQWVAMVLGQAGADTMAELHAAHMALCQSILEGRPDQGLAAIDRHYDIVDRMMQGLDA